jgi:5-(carboxyamino)imidazole ribonucleotide synthase
MTTVGILGGGQLARMLALSGAPLGLRFLVLDTVSDACAAQYVPSLQADWRDEHALAAFAAQVDVATFDFENVPAESAHWLAGRVPVFPSARALAVAQDRLAEKSLFRELGIDVPDFADIASRTELDAGIARIGTPAILKTRRLGYDGKGQFRIRTHADLDAAWAALGAQAPSVGLILEAFVPFQRELSVIAVRGRDGEFRTWPLTENWHEQGVLSASLAPARTDQAIATQAVDYARRLAESLDYVGVFALELFLRDGRLLANEMAPRVHNSGHWSIEGAETSQFENHLRAVLGLPLGSTRMLGQACMLNWIGELPDANAVLAEPCGHWHDYGKSARAGRKVGHATFRADSSEELAASLQRCAAALGRKPQVEPVLARLAESHDQA